MSWNDVHNFCCKLSKRDREYNYRLPTAAEWEHAYRANSLQPTSPSDKFKNIINAFGLQGMGEKGWEWCYDNYTEDIALSSNVKIKEANGYFVLIDPMNKIGKAKILKSANNVSPSYRGMLSPSTKLGTATFRLVREKKNLDIA